MTVGGGLRSADTDAEAAGGKGITRYVESSALRKRSYDADLDLIFTSIPRVNVVK